VTDQLTADNLTKNHVNFVVATPGTSRVLDLFNPDQGTARVVFSNGSSSFFTGPTKYPGLDTNDREQRVQNSRNNSISPSGSRTALGAQSMIPSRRAELQATFRLDDASKNVRKEGTTPAEFNEAFQDFIYNRVLHGYAETVAVQNIASLQAWVDRNPAPSPVTAAWAQRLGMEAIGLVCAYDNSNVFAQEHDNTWYVEDEAAAQILVERVHPGLKVNFDIDANTVRVR
jgi:hypothetical protein